MRIADDDDNTSGMLFGDVIGTESNGSITLTFKTVHRSGGSYGCFFDPKDNEYYAIITVGDVIAKISKSGRAYKIQPLGKMSEYLSGLGGKLTITKIK